MLLLLVIFRLSLFFCGMRMIVGGYSDGVETFRAHKDGIRGSMKTAKGRGRGGVIRGTPRM